MLETGKLRFHVIQHPVYRMGTVWESEIYDLPRRNCIPRLTLLIIFRTADHQRSVFLSVIFAAGAAALNGNMFPAASRSGAVLVYRQMLSRSPSST